MLANLALAPLILRQTSQAQYGFWLTALSVLGYLGLMDLGLGMALTRAIAAEAGRADDIRLNRLISTGFFAFSVAGLVFAAVGLCLAPWIPRWFGIPPADAPAVLRAFRIVVVASAAALPASVFSGVLCGFQRMAVDNLVRTGVGVAALVVSLALLWFGWGLSALALSTLFTVVASSALAARWAWRCFPGLRLSLKQVNCADLRELLGFGGYFQLARIANTVAVNSDSLVISNVLGAQCVTPYVFTSKLATLCSQALASKLPIAALPAMSQMFGVKDFAGLQSAFIRLSVYATRLAVVGCTVCALGTREFVTLWVGGGQFGGAALTAVFCYWVLQDTIYRGTASTIYATGQVRSFALASLAEASLNLGFSLLLVRHFGLVGVAFGTSIGKTLTTAWVMPVLVCHGIGLGLGRYVWQGIARPALSSLPGVAAAGFVWAGLGAGSAWWKLAVLGATAVLANVAAFEGLRCVRDPSSSLLVLRGLLGRTK